MTDQTESNETEQGGIPPLPPIKDGVGLSTHIFLVLCLALVGLFSYWAWRGSLAVVSVAEGEVVPSSQVKAIQHLEGGIVREISVREGENVTAGQPLIVLESTSSGADVNELRARIVGLKVEIARLTAEATGADAPRFESELERHHPRLVHEAKQLFLSRKARLLDEIASQKAIIEQREQDIREISARIRNQKKSLNLLREQIKLSEQLLKDELTNRYKHLDFLKEAARLEGAIEQDEVALDRARFALTQAQANFASVRSIFSEKANQALDSARRQLSEFTPRLTKFEDNLKRTVLRSPVDGVVKSLHVVTVGGVVKAGDVVVDIVPADDRLIVEAKLPTEDIGFVRGGQEAVIKLASANGGMRFENLPGRVVEVSPDSLTDTDGSPFYRVRIETARNHFARGEIRYDLSPGMQVTTSIITGQRRVYEYLFDPFLNAGAEALRER